MKIVIEFYLTRDTDDAHAVVGHEVEEAQRSIPAPSMLKQ